MRLIRYDETVSRPLPFYLAMEEYFARPEWTDDFFFMWQVDPTVICGRNQLLEKEINLGFCRENGIAVCRRKSGGGAVFADRRNIMFSCITSSADGVRAVFSDYTSRVAAMLRLLGLDATDNTRNDILIGDRKVSGNAYYHAGRRSIVHGTMLYDTDPRLMAGALTPSVAKLDSKGVASVGARITTLRRELPALGLEEFKDFVRKNLCDGTPYTLTDADIAAIERLAGPYFEPEWLLGQNPEGTLVRELRIPGAGEFRVAVTLVHDKIKKVSLTGDFFMTADPDTALLNRLRGVSYTRRAIAEALGSTDVGSVLPGLTNEKLIDLLLWKK